MKMLNGYDAWKTATPPWYDDPELELLCDDCSEPLPLEDQLQDKTTCTACEVWNRMYHYSNKGGNSGLLRFRSGNNWIELLFKGYKGPDSLYRYTSKSCGYDTIKRMQFLARHGSGLCAFVNLNKPPYVYKEKV